MIITSHPASKERPHDTRHRARFDTKTMRRTFPQAFGTGNHLVDSFHVLFPRRKAQKFVITPKMLQLCALYDSASVVQWIE